MTVAVEVGGRGVGVAGVGVFGARVGGDVGGAVVGAVGDGVWGAPDVAAAEGTSVVATADGLAVSGPAAADDATPLVSPQPVTRKTTATSPARQDWCAIVGEDAGGARPRGSLQVRCNSGRGSVRGYQPPPQPPVTVSAKLNALKKTMPTAMRTSWTETTRSAIRHTRPGRGGSARVSGTAMASITRRVYAQDKGQSDG